MKIVKNFIIDRHLNSLFKSYELYLVNLTFSDECLSTSTYKERLEMIKKYLDKYCSHYVAGQQFNDKEREYYVCIVNSKVNYKEYRYKAFGHKIARQSPDAYKKYFHDNDFVAWK